MQFFIGAFFYFYSRYLRGDQNIGFFPRRYRFYFFLYFLLYLYDLVS